MTTITLPAESRAGQARAAGAPRRAIDRQTLLLLPLGIALGARGLNVLPDSVLSFLSPAVSAALAVMGALAGVGLHGDRRREPALGASVAIDASLTFVAVAAGLLAAWRAAAQPGEAGVIAAVCFGVAAIPFSLSARDAAQASSPLAARTSEAGLAMAIVAGAFAVAWPANRSSAEAISAAGQLAGIAAVVAAAGWLLAGQTSDDNEQRVLAVGTVLLLGGAADYLGASALFTGLVAGACWRVAGHAGRDRLTRDLELLQHPLVVLLLVIAGAHCRFSATALGLAVVYAVGRAAAKLISGFLVGRVAAAGRPLSMGVSCLPPGAAGVAVALTVATAWNDPAAQLVLDVVVIGTLAGELLALAFRRERS
jgi:hypothetical protein